MSNAPEQSHTPGSWRLGPVTTKAGRNKLALTCSTHRICDISVYNDVDHANARLIAAAPELLEALKDLWGRLEFSHEMWPEMKAARAAIARAEGK